MTPLGEEKQKLLRMNAGDSASIHSFASSSSTLAAPPVSPTEEKDSSFLSVLEDPEQPHTLVFASPPPLQHSWRQTPLTLRVVTTLLQFASTLLPSYLQPRASKTHVLRKIHPTSYLDGLRGVAAFVVSLSHFILNWFYPLRNGYLSSATDTYFLQLPIIRLLFSGRASVSIFFVISGFVLSHKPLSLIRSNQSSAVLTTLSSSVFRRSIRLYVPIIFETFISAILAYNGCYLPTPARNETIPPQLPTLREQILHWWAALVEFVFPFNERGVDGNHAGGFSYNGHLWTIPVEFYGSVVVFVSVLGTAGVRGGARMGGLAGLGIWGLGEGRWDVACFLGGVVLAEWSIVNSCQGEGLPYHQHDNSYHQKESEKTAFRNPGQLGRLMRKSFTALQRLSVPGLRALRAFRGPLNILLLFISLFLLSYAGESPSPGLYHNFLIPYTPEIWESIFLGREHFWLTLGSLLLVFTLSNSTTLQRPFISRFAHYLGDISYSLYIVHGMVLFTLGTHLQERWTGQVGRTEWADNGWGELVETVVRTEVDWVRYGWAFAGAAVVNFLVVGWGADLFWRLVDGRCVAWGRWVEGVVKERRAR